VFSSFVVPLDKLYHIACGSTAKTVKGASLRVDLQAGIFVTMKGTFYEVVPIRLEIVVTQDGLYGKSLFDLGYLHC